MKRQFVSIVGVLSALFLLTGPVAAEPHHLQDKGHGERAEAKKCDKPRSKCDKKHGVCEKPQKKCNKKCDKRSHHAKCDKSFVLRHHKALGLSDEQIKKIKSLKRETKKKTIRIQAEIDIAEIDLKAMKYAEEVDMTKIAEVMRAIAVNKAEIKIAWMQYKVDSKAVLSDEQRAQLKEIYKKKHAGKGHGHKL